MRASLVLIGLASAFGFTATAASTGRASIKSSSSLELPQGDKTKEKFEEEQAWREKRIKNGVETGSEACWDLYLKRKEPILNCLKDVQELYRTRPVVTPEMLPELERDAMGEYIKCRKQGRSKKACEDEAEIEVDVKGEDGQKERKVIDPGRGVMLENPPPSPSLRKSQFQRSPSGASSALFGLRPTSLRDVAVGGGFVGGGAALGAGLVGGARRVLESVVRSPVSGF